MTGLFVSRRLSVRAEGAAAAGTQAREVPCAATHGLGFTRVHRGLAARLQQLFSVVVAAAGKNATPQTSAGAPAWGAATVFAIP